MHHAFQDFIDGAVAARGHYQGGTAADPRARNPTRGPGTGGGGHAHVVAVFRQELRRPLDERVSFPSESSRPGIVDEDGLLVGCDWLFSGFLVRL